MERSSSSYYFHSRPELRVLVPVDAQRILDVGCGAGELGRLLKAERPGVTVAGIELERTVAAVASAVLDRVICGDAEDIEIPFQPGDFDCVIFADVLEHMRNPVDTIRRYTSLLRPGGSVVASVPNIAHLSVILNLLRHRWFYSERGLLDKGHVRFFTRSSVLELFESLGFRKITLEREYRLTDRPAEHSHQTTARFFARILLGDHLAYRFYVLASDCVEV